MHGYVEHQTLIGPAEECRHQHEVSGTGYRQELSKPLHNGKNDNLQPGHGRPPGPCLFVTMCVPGRRH